MIWKVGGPIETFFAYHASTARSPVFINSREVTGRYTLDPGSYLVIPTTFEPGHNGDFIVRIYSEKPVKTGQVDVKTTIQSRDERKASYRSNRTSEEDEAADASFKALFQKLAGEDREIDAFELQQILTTATKKVMFGKEFSIEACRSIIDFKDEDKTGKLGYDEFKEVWALIKSLLTVFTQFDADGSGSMDMCELRLALFKQGISLSQATLNAISARFNNKKGTLCFDDFIQIVSRIYSIKDDFDKHADRTGKATFTVDEFMTAVITC